MRHRFRHLGSLAAACATLFTLTAAPDAEAIQESVTVYSQREWTNVQYPHQVHKNCTITYTGGQWTANDGTTLDDLELMFKSKTFDAWYSQREGKYGPEGDITKPAPAGYPIPGAPEGALIARVGNIVFPVGDYYVVPDFMAGPLELGMNMTRIRPGATGELVVQVRCP